MVKILWLALLLYMSSTNANSIIEFIEDLFERHDDEEQEDIAVVATALRDDPPPPICNYGKSDDEFCKCESVSNKCTISTQIHPYDFSSIIFDNSTATFG